MTDCVYFELKDSEGYSQLEEASASDFYMWNATSLGNLFVAASGFNELRVRKKAIKLLEQFYEYLVVLKSCILGTGTTKGRTHGTIVKNCRVC